MLNAIEPHSILFRSRVGNSIRSSSSPIRSHPFRIRAGERIANHGQDPNKRRDELLVISTLLAERHHFRRPVAERIKRFVGFAAGASASKALTASATRKKALVEFWW